MDAQRLYSGMRERELLGCNCSCLSKKIWFLPNTAGCDHRSPSSCVQAYLRREYGIEVEEDLHLPETDQGPRWSDTHPYEIVFNTGEDDVFVAADDIVEAAGNDAQLDRLETMFRYWGSEL